MKSIQNYELRVRRVKLADAGAPYGEPVREPADVGRIAQELIGDLWCAWSYVAATPKMRVVGGSRTGDSP